MRSRAARTTPLLLLAIALMSFAACMVATEPLPDGSRRITAPVVYQVWWHMTESCSGRTGQLATVDWYVVPGVAQFEHKGHTVSGYWSSAGNRVVLAERAMTDGGLVRHEMLHALLGHSVHSRDAFFERCGGAVVCLTGCLQDLGSAPIIGPTVARVSPGEMQIDVAVDPGQPQRTVDEGHFRLVVTVTNPRADSVVVLLPSSGDAPPASFSFLLSSGRTGLWFTEHAWDTGVTVFAPGASRRAVFDFKLADRFDGIRALPEGVYEVKGGFGPASSVTRSYVFGQGR
jgi:hypothetical protein